MVNVALPTLAEEFGVLTTDIEWVAVGYLLGLAAVVIPILVHLTRKQRARVVEFPSLMFLDRVPFQAESRRRIHHWLLLLLRALAVALIVAAFSRPFFTGSAVAAGLGMGPREVVVLQYSIDTQCSTSARRKLFK
ncbi:MAG: BatA domain-containing protein [Gammaproteobacteria bacterium]